MKNDERRRLFRQLSRLTQLGLELVLPPVGCLLLCSWIANRSGAGAWIFLPGLLLGLGASGVTAWKEYRRVREKTKREPRPVYGRNTHI